MSTGCSATPSAAPSWLTTEVRSETDGVRALLVGELDLATADQLTGLVDELVRDGCRSLVLDLTALALCDARGLSAFLAVHRALADAGGDLTMTGVPPLVRQLLDITELSTVFRLR
jgi:anti-anti-sigma factor